MIMMPGSSPHFLFVHPRGVTHRSWKKERGFSPLGTNGDEKGAEPKRESGDILFFVAITDCNCMIFIFLWAFLEKDIKFSLTPPPNFFKSLLVW